MGDGEQMLMCGNNVRVLGGEVCVAIDDNLSLGVLGGIRSMHQGQVHQ